MRRSPTTHTWPSRMVTTAKSNGDPRRTIDYQPLNKHSQRQTLPVQSPFQLASQVPSNMKKSVVDAWNGYHQISLHPDHMHYTTLPNKWGRYRYRDTTWPLKATWSVVAGTMRGTTPSPRGSVPAPIWTFVPDMGYSPVPLNSSSAKTQSPSRGCRYHPTQSCHPPSSYSPLLTSLHPRISLEPGHSSA